MGKKLTEGQEVVAKFLGDSYSALKQQRGRLVREAHAWVEQQLQEERGRIAQDVLWAYEDYGMTIAQIGGALGTSARKTVYEMLEQARKENK